MKLTEKHEIIVLFLIYGIALYLWTAPINSMPFGDVDAPMHFTVSDYMTQNDKTMINLPYYLAFFVGGLAEGKLWYPPQFHTAAAIVQALVQSVMQERIIPLFFFYAFASTLFILSSYLLARSLFGFLPAALSSFLLIFSYRDYFYYSHGLWPQVLSFTFVPVVIYCIYKYTDSFLNKSVQNKYLYMGVILAVFQYLFHPQGLVFTVGFGVVFFLLAGIKTKKIPFSLKHIIIAGISGVVLLVILSPFQLQTSIDVFLLKDSPSPSGGFGLYKPQTLLSWYADPKDSAGSVPDVLFRYEYVHYGYWTLPFVILGIIILLLRRNLKDLVMISFLISLYIYFHFDVFGLPRAHRFLEIEAMAFYPIAAFGIISIASFIPVNAEIKKYLKFALAGVFIILAIAYNMQGFNKEIQNTYPGFGRVLPQQYQAAMWMDKNLPENAHVAINGIVIPAKRKWMMALSHRHTIYDYSPDTILKDVEDINLTDYVLVDYNDILAWGNSNLANWVYSWELTRLQNQTVIYNQSNIRVYKLESKIY